MKRYIAKERPLTPAEQLASYRMRVREAAEDTRQAQLRLIEAIESELPATATEYLEVKPGEPGYEDAPFENSFVMSARDAIDADLRNRSPWVELINRGKYPSGLGEGATEP